MNLHSITPLIPDETRHVMETFERIEAPNGWHIRFEPPERLIFWRPQTYGLDAIREQTLTTSDYEYYLERYRTGR